MKKKKNKNEEIMKNNNNNVKMKNEIWKIMKKKIMKKNVNMKQIMCENGMKRRKWNK